MTVDVSQASVTAVERANLAFSVEGLDAREELLFKSIVRLLSHRTHHSWLYAPVQSGGEVHLRVISDRLPAQVEAASYQVPTITLTTSATRQPGFLGLPIRANELEDELNRVGNLLELGRSLAPSTPTTLSTSMAATVQPAAPGAHAISGNSSFRLRRWPAAGLLASTARLRLATLLTGQSLPLDELVRRSGQSLAACTEFINELMAAGFVTVQVSAVAPLGTLPAAIDKPASRVAPAGLLARIRSRLGL